MIEKIMGIQPMADPDCRSTKMIPKCKKPSLRSLCVPKRVIYEYYVDSNDSSMICDSYESDHCCDW